ncbi:MAG TPA: acetylglutamate kinase [Nitrospiraceae bacterium]|nr:MAG: acetylglutamate kinase [Nitrospirae bacterium GWA2_46_11]OGW26132.1 MAG: acetylglutamate kinase [Nitrospirae bacterium GWB2_47_37]HAK89409.1 acetylglutamate kinase [Nitrospiraceae bacterium]HCL80895.1 acetylglutamate kinase [Nitrospiraceae bacterium]HCZ11198.1 acetylglutamate kinase [Nitrospiraceae bacterium]
MKKLIEKANVLIEALPYIRNFYGKTFVIKYGGAAQIEEKLKDSFAQDVVLLSFIGIKPVIVHGGGPKISETMKKMGKEPAFIQGQRVTDKETMDIVEMVLGGLVNKEIVSLINSHGGKAAGLSGKDGGLIKAKKKVLRKSAPSGEEEIIDIGLVGEVDSVAPEILGSLEKDGFIPVISPIGVGSKGEAFNINADYVASAIASALKAEKLILLTDVPGIKNKKGDVISSVNKKGIKELIDDGTVSGGMLPKVQACTRAVDSGVKKTHIVDGRIAHCLLLEIFTKEGIGTEIVA